MLFALAFEPLRSTACALVRGLVARSDTVLGGANWPWLAIVLVLANGLLLPLASLTTTGFCTVGKAAIVAAAEGVAEVAEAEEAEATATVALEAPEA